MSSQTQNGAMVENDQNSDSIWVLLDYDKALEFARKEYPREFSGRGYEELYSQSFNHVHKQISDALHGNSVVKGENVNVVCISFDREDAYHFVAPKPQANYGAIDIIHEKVKKELSVKDEVVAKESALDKIHVKWIKLKKFMIKWWKCQI